MRQLKICYVSAEIAPFAKTGGLGDVGGGLIKFMSRAGQEVRAFLPFYDIVDTSKQDFHIVDYLRDIPIQCGHDVFTFSVLTAKLPKSDVDVYFIHCPRLYFRGSIYTNDGDDYLRFAFFSQAVIECCQRMGWAPDIFHCHDWHTALVPVYLNTIYNWDSLFHNSRKVLTIHNIGYGYQGIFGSTITGQINLLNHHGYLDPGDFDRGIFNYLKNGIIHADFITTVSETFAREIQTPEFGDGLDPLLRYRSQRVIGIVNGVDYEEWSPESDPNIPYHYSLNDLSGKEKNKKHLMDTLELHNDPNAPLLGVVSRLTEQKGIELFFDCMFDILYFNNIRMVILGSGAHLYQEFFAGLQHQFPNRVCYYRGYNETLSHLIQAASDIFIMPSRYEPCGLTQIYSLKYGTVPVVRKTGGLADTVQLYNPDNQTGTGFVFEHYTSAGLSWAINFAIGTFPYKDAWGTLMRNGMQQNFSWDLQVQKYFQVFESIL